MNEVEKFRKECLERASSYKGSNLERIAKEFIAESTVPKYSYNFSWMGRPIIQYPQDIVAMHELIWQVRPDLIIETGIAHGGSLIMNASMLSLIEYCEAMEVGSSLDPLKPKRRVLGIDIDIRDHNRKEIEAHPMRNRIDMIQGSSIDEKIIRQVYDYSSDYSNILVCLDSNHTHDHVFAELEAYAPLTSKNSYCIVFDTLIEDLPKEMYADRNWGPGNNPRTAVWKYLKKLNENKIKGVDNNPLSLQVDSAIENKILITVAPGGYLKRV